MQEYGSNGEPPSDLEPRRSDGANPRRWWPLLAVGLTAVVIIAVAQHPSAPLATPTPHTSTQAPAPSPIKTSTAAAPTTPVAIVEPRPTAGRTNQIPVQILGVSTGWELFARSEKAVIRIELAQGRVSQTPVPRLTSSGPVSFVVAPDRVIIRPLDSVTGYAVLDGEPATPLINDLAKGGPAVSGPDPLHLWVDLSGSRGDVITLVTLDGNPVGTTIPVPTNRYSISAASDENGRVLLTGEDGSTHVMGPGTDELVTSGTVVAAGRTGVLVTQCPPHGRCASSMIGHGSGRHSALPHAITDSVTPGLISPDGRYAAVVGSAGTTTSEGRLSLIHLTTGTRQIMPTSIGAPTGPARMVWSPDGRWLFVVVEHGQIAAIDPADGQITDLGITLPPVSQLGVRHGR